jgi:hypothetical protein
MQGRGYGKWLYGLPDKKDFGKTAKEQYILENAQELLLWASSDHLFRLSTCETTTPKPNGDSESFCLSSRFFIVLIMSQHMQNTCRRHSPRLLLHL